MRKRRNGVQIRDVDEVIEEGAVREGLCFQRWVPAPGVQRLKLKVPT